MKELGLPKCKIIETLILKSESKIDYEFDHIFQLEQLRKLISIEVSRINLLFPEYTPHDEKYHLKRLFYVADQLLGEDLIENMNVTELFLLSVSLYAHDWGMAVSENEKDFILFGSETEDKDLNILEDERKRLQVFCRGKDIQPSTMTIEDWQEYVRRTHAFRSGSRIKKYFEPISSGIGEFASRICEGHWLDFDIINDYTSYPTDASVHRDVVNIKALSIYVRLIDLLDLGEDRTPYVLWKFVAPRNHFSKLEWAKHRALQPVTFPNYQVGRFIQVEGSTSDQHVFMSIMDLKRYVNDQFRQCADIMNRINHPYHKLNITHIDWRVAPRGFEPTTIQFEFDRSRMFEILGNDIYQGNPFIFIRELIQNAIDAIRMRQEILVKKDLSFQPKIKLNVEERDDIIEVKISDNGIGMDEYVIRNYLAVAGKSYYKSIDFQKEGVEMDPISRFGIGVLSCFMVADYIEIESYKDPNTTNHHDHLRITIPAKENYFKIIKNQDQFPIGTKFTVLIEKKRLPKIKKTEQKLDFNVTNYLRRTAGFVDYPIFISEKGSETVIRRPETSQTSNQKILSLDYSFPINKAFLPSYTDTVKEFFTEKRIHLKRDLKLENYDGCLTYLLPKFENIDITNESFSWPVDEVRLFDYLNITKPQPKICWKHAWSDFRQYYGEVGEFQIPERSYSVFMDGILLTDITPPEIDIPLESDEQLSKIYREGIIDSFISPQLIANIPKPLEMKIDLARTTIETGAKWDTEIWIALSKYLKETVVEEIIQQEPKQRLLSIAKLVTFYKLPHKLIFECLIEKTSFVIPVISPKGKLKIKIFNSSEMDTLRIAPMELTMECFKLLKDQYFEEWQYEGAYNFWIGPETVLNLHSLRYTSNIPASLLNTANLLKFFIARHYFFHSIEFIASPQGEGSPLVQEIFKLQKDAFCFHEDHPISLQEWEQKSILDFSKLNKKVKKKLSNFPKIISFPAPYHKKIFYSARYINFEHPLTKAILKIYLELESAIEEETMSEKISGKIFDLLKELPFQGGFFEDSKIDLKELNTKLSLLFIEARKLKLTTWTNKHLISLEDFVPNSVLKDQENETLDLEFDPEVYLSGKQKWGQKIQ